MFFIINVYTYYLRKENGRKKTEDLSAVLSLHNMPQFSIRYCSNSLDTNCSKSGFFVNFLQVYRYFFCNEINSRSLPLWGFDNCEKQEPSKEFVCWKVVTLCCENQ